MTRPRPVLSPNTGGVIGHWQPTPEPELAAALAAVDAALDRLAATAERRRLLAAAEAALLNRREQLAGWVVREVGKKPAEAAAEVAYAAGFFAAAREALESAVLETRPGSGRRIREVPYGAALLIAPFNDPLAGLARKIAPALAAGAPALVKPSRLAILTAKSLLQVLAEAGLADFVRLVAPAQNDTVAALMADHRIGVVSFTGSTEVGRDIAVRAAGLGTRAILELGGNCPFVVLADADPERALADLLDRKLRSAGQACSAVNRVFVAGNLYADFRAALLDRVARLRTGPSDRPGIDLGPVRTRAAAARLLDLVDAATGAGERLLTGRPALPAADAACTLPLSVVESDGAGVFDRRESFGPALGLRRFDSLDRLLAELAGERQALAAYFHTGDAAALLPRLERLRFGSIGINTVAVQDPAVPTGGFRSAGLGREGGIWGVREFLAPVNLRVGPVAGGADRGRSP